MSNKHCKDCANYDEHKKPNNGLAMGYCSLFDVFANPNHSCKEWTLITFRDEAFGLAIKKLMEKEDEINSEELN